MNVSKNSGFSPQIIPILIGVFPLFSPSILGETPLFFGNIHMHPVVIFPPSISLGLDFCSTCFVRKTEEKIPQLGCLSDHGVSQHQTKEVCWNKQSFVTLENSWTRSWNRHHSRPFKSILFQQLKIPIRWTSTWTILNLSPPKLSYVLPSQTPVFFQRIIQEERGKIHPQSLAAQLIQPFIYKGCPKIFDNPSIFPPGNFDRALFFSVWKSRAARPFSSRSRQYSWQFWTRVKIIFCTDWKIYASCLCLIWALIYIYINTVRNNIRLRWILYLDSMIFQSLMCFEKTNHYMVVHSVLPKH